MSGCRVAIASVVAAILSTAGLAAAQTAADAKRTGVMSSKTTLPFEDRFAIHELFARYSQALDMGLGEELVTNVFAPDGIFHDPSLCLVGHDELKKGLTTHNSHARTSQHWPNNIVITEVSGNTVKTHTYVIVFNTRGGAPTMGTYHDTLVKTNGKWLIQKREVWRPGEVKKDPRCPTDLTTIEP